MADYEKRIHGILGDNERRTKHNANRYRKYLLKNLSLPILVTGSVDFPWEEPYVIGGWDKREYEELKKTNPSYKDTFELEALLLPNEHADIVAQLRRLSDGERFTIGLSWLSYHDKRSAAYTLLNDYSIWHANY
jgi:hypothetical protein